MMKEMSKAIIIILVSVLLLQVFGSCSVGIQNDKPVPSADSSMPPADPTALPSNTSYIPEPTPDPYPRETSGYLLSYDPGAEVYFSFSNQDVDFYPGSYFSTRSFYILSTHRADTADIKVEFEMQNEYEVSIADITREYHLYSNGDIYWGISYDHYCCIKGFDWQELNTLRCAANSSEAQRESLDPGTVTGWEQTPESAAFQEKELEYWDEYRSLDMSTLPEFYVYGVDVFLPSVAQEQGIIPETVERCTVTFNGKSYAVAFGKWIFHDSFPDALKQYSPYVQQRNYALLSITGGLCTEGYLNLQSVFDLGVSKDVTVTGISVYEDKAEVVGAHIYIDNGEGETSSDYYWDASMPFDLLNGTQAVIDIIIRDDSFKNYEIGRSIYLILDYESDGRPFRIVTPCNLTRRTNAAEAYLMVFENVDMNDYYAWQRVYLYEPFLAEMPDSWRDW